MWLSLDIKCRRIPSQVEIFTDKPSPSTLPE
jgi:hypothetical protein